MKHPSELPPLSDELRRLLAESEEAPDPALEIVAEQVHGSVLRTLVLREALHVPSAQVRLGAAATTTATAAKGSLIAVAISTAIASGTIGAGLGYSYGVSQRGSVVADAAPLAPSAAHANAPIPSWVESLPAVAITSIPVVPTQTPAPSTTPAATSNVDPQNALKQERELVDAAGAALRSGHPEQALSDAARHRTRFPKGQLSEEREAVTIRALVALGRIEEARTRTQEFRRQFAGSPQVSSLERLTE